MQSLKLKVCGLKNEENTLQVIKRIKPEYIGHIFFLKSKRYLETPFSKTFYQSISDLKIVGVFVNEKIDVIIEKIKLFNLSVIQLHGSETPNFCASLRNKIPKNVDIWKSITLLDTNQLRILNSWEKYIDMFLFDAAIKNQNNIIDVGGGTGVKWDWELIDSYHLSTPFVLSGGISNSEVCCINALSEKNRLLSVVDVNSKYEISPGLKNINLLKVLKQSII